MNVYVHHGSRRLKEIPDEIDVVVTSYTLLRIDPDVFSRSWRLLFLDEAQRIKNRGSQTSKAVCSIPRKRSWALTGTPVENRSEDLVGIFDFVAPGQVHDGMSPRVLGTAAKGHCLRRTKDKVLKDMPPRLDTDRYIELSNEQRETYRRAEEEGVLRLSEMGQEAAGQQQ